MNPVEHPVVAEDGHRFCLRIVEPAASRAHLLFLPALGVPAAKYDAFAAALAGHGIRVAVAEWRGIGSSAWRAGRGIDWGYGTLLGRDLRAARAALGPGAWHYGGHSLGGQFAAMLAALDPEACAGLVLVATGVPHERLYRGAAGLAIAAFARLLPALTRLCGHYPGHRLGFAGREAGGVMRDWARTVRHGVYEDYGTGGSLEDRMRRLAVPVLGLSLAEDWLAPAVTLAALMDKLGPGPHRAMTLDGGRLGVRADHFRWMRRPDGLAQTVADWLLSP
ncbi:alpha/beta hydrolase family protein [Arenimonas fontis]|uniref:Alpha/beta fold hydrolase n=1 Tax=Arenimonas fontis TaxID=2608255 RepID=A0A5B2ZA91_9GAMM|nr:alpha/beta fold hydrolase [Arenimonas fontis]KAA2284453.1 alpha/beta fold hydrolase [Arenimonas fontis]